ncbi:glycine/D-amino acid oxidase (deaminating) [Rubidibacter lacunae KORDI 51-2]|uniref:Glycine/D-amino acid oxidase (Deaminating) n=1 Tax=Rubidibacter lacunae KORDI 51-2 TaxID=582515 RepID=U5DI54_9CHRO|nr:FAD-dependent oxidoreductase [Rubidibacter lacunae]ERN40284.1 glycine/D-amino acid oxidase (deaminating) [Rubidibacter lacunae KORDI 51-2]
MSRIAIVGGGVVGATIAYELSGVSGLDVQLFERGQPASASTWAALGLLVAVSSRKTKGRAWELRAASLRQYPTLIDELEALSGMAIPVNRQGLISLCYDAARLSDWEQLVAWRRDRGWTLELWEPQVVRSRCPHLDLTGAIAGIYSPQDWQIDPQALTQAAIAAAERRGATCYRETTVEAIAAADGTCSAVHTTAGTFECDWLVIAAGLGSLPLTAMLDQPLALRPVLGQAIEVVAPHELGDPAFQPVVTADDVHAVPLGDRRYWIGATVEFPDAAGAIAAAPELLAQMQARAVAFCPELAAADIVRTWSGLRPRPEGRAAPVIGPLAGYRNVLLATGHYRNGILLAPATALAVRAAIACG